MSHPERFVPRRIATLLLLACLAAIALAGCGQKGDLYLPDRPDEQRPHDDDDST